MRIRVLLLLAASTLFAADDQQLALALRAQTDFDRVELGIHAQLGDTNACVQSQAAAISVASRSELSSLDFRKGYCALVGATLTRRAADFLEAAADFEKSIAAWPDTIGRNPTNSVPQPVSSGLRILAAVSRLEANPTTPAEKDKQEIDTAVEGQACPTSVMSVSLCQSMVGVGRQWLGWLALQQNDLFEAARDFSSAPQSAWTVWTAGRKAFHDRNYQDASVRYGEAVRLWSGAQSGLLAARLEPHPDMGSAWMDLGGAQILAGQPGEAIPSLDAAIKADPMLARAIFYRARAEDLVGRAEAAIADYNLASRTAFANAKDLMSGEAHLYRGISLFRRKNYSQAEDEFASALNFGIPEEMRHDAEAWRYMAAVAGGACGSSRHLLEDSLAYASPFFPKQEARSLAAACPLSVGSSVSTSLP
jgi:tetratricopeptide (TPR) repeat protein